MKDFFRVLRYFRPDAGRIVFAIILLLLSTSASLLKPWPLALIVDSVLGQKPLPAWWSWAVNWDKFFLLGFLSVVLLTLYIAQGVLFAWQNYASVKIGLRGLARVRNELFRRLERLSLRFHQSSNQGDLIYRASWDTYAFQTLFQQGVFTFLSASLSLLFMLLVMWRLNIRLTLLAMLLVPLMLLAMKCFGRGMTRRSLSAHQADSRVTSLIQQAIVAMPLIQSYTREVSEEKRFADQVSTALNKRVVQHGWELFYGMVIAIGFGFAAAGLTWLGATEVLAARLTVGQLLIFLAYLTQLYEPLSQLSHVGPTVSDARAQIQRVFELLDTPEEVYDAPDARPVLKGTANGRSKPLVVHGDITFDHASFGYDKDRLVLTDISFSAKAGESTAIIGPSGAGKTTLLQLLPRFYDPANGEVRLDNVDLRKLRLKDLRGQISLVLQEPILLFATIAENIAYGKPDATRAEIEAAARAANAEEFIRTLPEQYDTVVGEGAARLSVGEKQRINLARAFLKDALILVLDEPTSALDAESEALVVRSLTELMRNRTTLVVAHRLSTIRRVDKIVVLEGGRVTEMGTPEDLLRHDGYYARVMASAELRLD